MNSSGQRYPVSDVVYDVATLIHEKCTGLEALKRYQQDAQQGGHQEFAQLLQKLQQQDEQAVSELEQILRNNIGHSGK